MLTQPPDLVNQAPYFIARYDSNGACLFVSESGVKTLGYTANDLIGRSVYDLTHHQDQKELQKAFTNLRKGSFEQQVEYRLRHQDGTYVWMQGIFKSDHATANEVQGFAHEISHLKRLEIALNIISRQDQMIEEDDWFRILVSHITTALKVDYAFITKTEAGDKVKMLAFWKGDNFGNPFTYPLTNTPCDSVVNRGQSCYYPIGIQALFPHDMDLVALDAQGYFGAPVYSLDRQIIGHLAILDRATLRLSDAEMSLVRLFAARAGIELERRLRQAIN